MYFQHFTILRPFGIYLIFSFGHNSSICRQS
nr:MAG TPA: hypothetical protein [Caudoviricetes sp.]